MKKILIISLLTVINISCQSQIIESKAPDSNLVYYVTDDKKDIELMKAIYICGLCAIRNDALRMCRFRYAKKLKKEIKKLTNKKP